MRNKPTAWHLLGYIPNLKAYTSPRQEQQFSTDLKYTRVHQILKTILASYVKFQKEDHMNPITLTFGNYTKKLRLKTPCFFIIGDMQGGDKMACSAVCYSDKINRLCHKCDDKGEHSGDPYAVCNQIEMKNSKIG